MDYLQNDFIPNPDDLFQFMNKFNETSAAHSSGQNRAFDHAPPVHNRTEPCQTVIDKFADGIDWDHPPHPSLPAPHVPRSHVGGFGAPTDLPQRSRQMNMGYSPPATSPVNPNAGNLPPSAFFAVDPKHIGGQPPSAVYPPNLNPLHQTYKAASNLFNVPSPKTLVKGLGSEMTSGRKHSFPRSPPCLKSQSTLRRRVGMHRSRRPLHQTEAKAAPQGTYVYQCLWGPCDQFIHGDRNSIRKHLKEYHAVPVDKTLVTCLWEGTCGDEMRGDSIPRHIEVHLGVQWICSRCGVRLSRKDSGWRHTERHDGTDCAGADIDEHPGPKALCFSFDATSVC
ncbi:hypothetical protein BV22DRAFT_243656 [Leucogyrophana mollusca]|uniref:Uncharacterized protein n=1 Tax=Leucogyrophana mollusca TaxID=85980 RepID=A0ACB8BSU5_9AGAM|nr:hypothetical protein BV22DRAFT_243656 [Leucogyrophana mollusca]